MNLLKATIPGSAMTEDLCLEGAKVPIVDHEVTSFYDHLSENYHLIYRDWFSTIRNEQNIILDVLEAFGVTGRGARETNVLDCAAGIGTQAIAMATAGFNVTASDVSARSLEKIDRYRRQFCRSQNVERVSEIGTEVVEFTALDGRFPPECFDVVVCMDNAIAHTASKAELRRAIQSMMFVTKENGVLMLSVRPYDELIVSRPNLHPVVPRVVDGRMYFQIWNWIAAEKYDAHFFLVLGDTEVFHRSIRMRAVLESELRSICRELNLRIDCLDPSASGYFQPMYLIRRPG